MHVPLRASVLVPRISACLVVVVLLLVGCGGGSSDGGSGPPPSGPAVDPGGAGVTGGSISLQATAGDAQVSVGWNGNADTSYNLCHAREPILEFENCGLYQEGSLLIDVTPPLVVTNLFNGQRYHFRVEAIRGGERSVSLQASALPVATAPTSRHTIYVVDSVGRLATVDPIGGTVNLIGRMNVVMTDIAFHPDGDLFGISFSHLYKINEETAAITRVGSHNVLGGNSLVFSENAKLYAAASESFNLYEIDPASGAAKNLGSIGFRAAGDLAFFGDSLFLSSRDGALVNVDLDDLSRTLAVGYFNRTDVYGLAAGDDGALYGVAGTDIFKVNYQTGALRDIVSFGGKGLSEAYGMDSRTNLLKFMRPVNDGFVITRGYDYEAASGSHVGVDYVHPDLQVLATAPGTVVELQKNGAGCAPKCNKAGCGCEDRGFGNTVILEHQLETGVVYSMYAHLESFSPELSVGACVNRGELIGIMGGTGYGIDYYNTHLHFEIKDGNTLTNPSGTGTWFAYTPDSADNYGYRDPAGFIFRPSVFDAFVCP